MGEIVRKPELLTEPEAAERLRVSPGILRRYRKRGMIQAFRPPQTRSVLYTDRAIAQFIETYETPACETEKTASKSALSGSTSTTTAFGMSAGSTARSGKGDAAAFAREMLKKPSADSQNTKP